MKHYLFGALIIFSSIFINWSYTLPSKKAGISAWGMKKEIKQMAMSRHNYDYSKIPSECFAQYKIFDLRK